MSDNDIKLLINDLNAIKREVVQINTKLDERCDRHGEANIALDRRVNKLEIGQAKIIGAAMLLSVVANYILRGLGLT